MASAFKSPLHQMSRTSATDFWNDSCAIDELRYAIEHGAVGATSNPAIVLDVLRQEMPTWRGRIRALCAEHPADTEIELCWRLIEEMAVGAAKLLEPVFRREGGKKGRLSIQTDPTRYRNRAALVEQALHFHGLGPNLQVKIPVTHAGVEAIEEATARGVNINATVCFSVAQALAAGEAVEHGLRRREAEGADVASMAPVCTIMVGRIEDWLGVQMARDGIVPHPDAVPWAGVACFKKAHALFRERGYRARLLAAAYRHRLHWTELVGGDVVLTIPYVWQRRFNASGLSPEPRFELPVEPWIVAELEGRFSDFRRAYDEHGLARAEFDEFGPTRRTLRSFAKAYHELVAIVRDVMLPDPDVHR